MLKSFITMKPHLEDQDVVELKVENLLNNKLTTSNGDLDKTSVRSILKNVPSDPSKLSNTANESDAQFKNTISNIFNRLSRKSSGHDFTESGRDKTCNGGNGKVAEDLHVIRFKKIDASLDDNNNNDGDVKDKCEPVVNGKKQSWGSCWKSLESIL